MKKLLTTLALIFTVSSTASAASLYTTTIMDVTPEQVQDALIEIFTGKNFVIDDSRASLTQHHSLIIHLNVGIKARERRQRHKKKIRGGA